MSRIKSEGRTSASALGTETPLAAFLLSELGANAIKAASSLPCLRMFLQAQRQIFGKGLLTAAGARTFLSAAMFENPMASGSPGCLESSWLAADRNVRAPLLASLFRRH